MLSGPLESFPSSISDTVFTTSQSDRRTDPKPLLSYLRARGNGSGVPWEFVTPLQSFSGNMAFAEFVNKTRLTQPLINFCMIVYMDDILVFSKTHEYHVEHIERVLHALKDAGFKVALEKSELFLSEISFLGYTIDGLKPDPRKVAAVQDAPAPVTLTQVWAFLGLASYYRCFIKGFAGIAKPLTNLLKKEELLIWTPECEAAFQGLKEALTSAPVLARPDPTRPFALYTDWQPQAISAVLTQHGKDGREHIIEYASKTLSQAQANYEACKGECLAVVWGIQHFRPYLYGQKFVLVTDHQPLLSLRNNTDYTGTLGRWAVCLQDYDFNIRHRATRQHGNADGLTRLLPPNKYPANERLIPWRPEVAGTKPHYGELRVLRDRFAPSARRAEAWTDLLLLRRLSGDSLSELTTAERRRVTERSQDYGWQGPTLQKRKVEDDGESSWLTVPYPLARFDWTRAAHEEDAVHFAVKYTEKAIEKNGWYWSGIREDVKYIVQNCPACAADKAPVQMPRTMVPTRVELPFQRVSIDTTDINVPRGPVDQGELSVLLVAVDHFSKWIEAYPMTSRNSQEVAWYINQFLCMHLDVEEVHMDNGLEFQGEVERNVVRADVKIIYSSGHWPQANGLVENANRLIKTALKRNITAGDTRPWPVIIDHILAVYRATPHGSTGVSPFQLRTNSVPRVHLSPLVGTEVRATRAQNRDKARHYMDLIARAYPPLARRRQQAVDRTHQRQIRDYENRHASAGPLPRYKVGDLVQVRKSARSSKIHPCYTGIYEVTEVSAQGQHFVKLIPRHNSQARPRTRHAAALRPFQPSLGSRMNHRQSEHEPLEHFLTPPADRLLRHRFNEKRQLRYDIQQVNVPAPGVADLAAYSLLCDRLTYARVYVDVTQLPGRETTRVFIEFRALPVAPNFVHSVATFIGDLTILPQPNREPAHSFVREYAVEAARSVATLQGRGGHQLTAHEVLLRRAEDGPIALLTEGPYPMREFSEYLVELTDVEPLPFADEDVWELHRALYKSVALGMFWFFVDHEDHCVGEHFVVYYVITRPKPAEKEGTVALYPFAQLQTIDPGLLELIHLELLSIAQVIASEEEEIQPRLRTATAPRRTYNAVVIPDYIAQRAERLEDFPEERPLRPPSSYPRPAPRKAPKKTPKRKRRHPSPGAQSSRIGGGEEVIQSARPRNPDPVPGSAATLVKEAVVPSPPVPRVPDLNLDGAGPSSAAAAGGGSRMGFTGSHIQTPRPRGTSPFPPATPGCPGH
ncbi:hypothetical protein CBR_g1163 [Chara braunii]|uniref:Integrase catalytic domain-containing protein n=1 Tax=Chara braunii TaxID=69332 RepID=A0A388KDA3_CHABU|nr:hypothetical protein CBR_g1163 [Chara braunii]|eukprot:GBG68042.1 hypothetical protein CBR_g1163 [Chara braunii]